MACGKRDDRRVWSDSGFPWDVLLYHMFLDFLLADLRTSYVE